MAFLGANDDDDETLSRIHMIRAPKAPVAAPKPLVPAGPAVVRRFNIRLSDYRRRDQQQAPAALDGGRNVCLVIDRKDVPAILGDAEQLPRLVFTPSGTANSGNGTIMSHAGGGAAAIPFAATTMSTMPVADAVGSRPTVAAAASAIYTVHERPSSGTGGAAIADEALLAPVDAILRTRRMIELEGAALGASASAKGLSAAWGMAVDSMDRRDGKLSAEVSHYDDAIEEAPAVVDVVAQQEQRAKRLRAEVDELVKATAGGSSSAAKAAPRAAAKQPPRAADTFLGSVTPASASAAAASSSSAPPTASVTAAPPAEKKIRFEPVAPPAVAPQQAAVASESVADIVARFVAQECSGGAVSVPAGAFVGRILKALPDFAAIAALRDKQREVQWLGEAKAKVVAALKNSGCSVLDGKVVFP